MCYTHTALNRSIFASDNFANLFRSPMANTNAISNCAISTSVYFATFHFRAMPNAYSSLHAQFIASIYRALNRLGAMISADAISYNVLSTILRIASWNFRAMFDADSLPHHHICAPVVCANTFRLRTHGYHAMIPCED